MFELETGAGRVFEVEFLVPLKGSVQERNTVLQPDIIAEKLRYIDLLYENAEMIELDIGNHEVKFQRPKPGVFIAHRALAVEKRTGEKKKKDVAYIIDLIHLFSDELYRLEQEVMEAKQRSGEHASWIKEAKQKVENYFLQDRDPLIHARERTEIDEVRGRALVRDFLDRI